MISYRPLFDFMHFNDLKIKNLIEDVGIHPRTAAKFRKGGSVTLETIEKICLYYDIPIEQVVKIVKEE